MKKNILWLACIATMSFIASCGPSAKQGNGTIKVVSWGGKFQNDLMNYWVKPAAVTAGLKVDEGTWDGDYAALSSKIKKNINAWDLVHVEDYYINVDNKDELFTRLPDDIKVNINPAYNNPYAMPILEYSYILAARRDLIGGAAPGTLNWNSMWDLKGIPGHRGLRDFPLGNIEIALLADGKDIKTYLYDKSIPKIELKKRVDAAIAKFDLIKKDIIWYSTGDQLQKSIESGETVLSAAWSGRVASAYKTLCANSSYDQCKKLMIVPGSALISVDWWVIPKNSAHAKEAIDLLRSAYSKENLEKAKGFANGQGYSLPLTSFSLPDKNELYYLNAGSERNKSAIGKISEEFWSKNFTWINKQWEDWRFK